MRDRTLTLRLTPQLHDALRDRAEAECRSVSGLLRAAALLYLDTPNRIPSLTAPSVTEDTP